MHGWMYRWCMDTHGKAIDIQDYPWWIPHSRGICLHLVGIARLNHGLNQLSNGINHVLIEFYLN